MDLATSIGELLLVLRNIFKQRKKQKWRVRDLSSPTSLGIYGERVAAEFLEYKSYQIIERNWRCPLGELDLICRKDSSLVVVEVKSRVDSGIARDNLFDSISPAKRRKLRILSEFYVNKGLTVVDEGADFPRIDVIGLVFSEVEELKYGFGCKQINGLEKEFLNQAVPRARLTRLPFELVYLEHLVAAV